MQSLVYSSVGVGVCVFGILIILHHIITSFRITLHHISYCINNTRIEYEANLRQMLRQNENVLRHEVSFRKYSFIRLALEGLFLYEA
jgi:5-bromo-4-chloroindolyl phosphate hydrolysis protein